MNSCPSIHLAFCPRLAAVTRDDSPHERQTDPDAFAV